MVEIRNWITIPISVIMSGSMRLVQHYVVYSMLTQSHSFSMATRVTVLEHLIRRAGAYSSFRPRSEPNKSLGLA